LTLYAIVALVATAVTVLALELWRMSPSVPLAYQGDALATANYLDTIRETGWYEVQDRLGAPFGLVFHDYPAADHLHLVIMALVMAVVPKFGVAMNAYFLVGFPLAAVTATWFLRTVGVDRIIAGALAVAFAIAPFHLQRGESHLFLASYWPIPLFLVLVVRVLLGRGLWDRAADRRGPASLVTWHNAGTLAILVVAGSATQYYALFDVLLLGIAALMALGRDRSWRALLGVVVGGAVVTLTLLLNMLPDLIHSATTTPSHGAADRPALHTERFAIKIAQLFLPVNEHRFEPFRVLTQRYITEFGYPVTDPLGLLAAAGVIILLVALTVATIGFARRARRVADPRRSLMAMFGALLVWILVVATSGGLGVFVALLVTTKVRGWERLAIYVALLGLAALGLAIHLGLRAARRRAAGHRRALAFLRRFAAAIVALLIVGIGYWDQTSPVFVPAYEHNRAEFAEDAVYAANLEATLPGGSEIFQLPYQPFPEGPFNVNAMTDYDHLKLGLFTDDLRYSYGGVKGRPTADWPIALAALPTDRVVDAAAAAGFAGISIDRDGYADHARALEADLAALLLVSPIVSERGTYSYWDLSAYRDGLVERIGVTEYEDLGYDTLHPVLAYGIAPNMTSPSVSDAGQSWQVRPGTSQLILASAAESPRTVRLSFYVASTFGLTSLQLRWPDGTESAVTIKPEGMPVTRTIEVGPGESHITVVAQSSSGTEFAIIGLQVNQLD
jgi:phosphoglycerol transferase